MTRVRLLVSWTLLWTPCAALQGCDWFVGGEVLPPRGDEWVVRKARSRRDGGCTAPRTFYRDRDGDGFGDPAETIRGCRLPKGYVENGEDCYDANPRAHPGQTDSFAVDRGDGSFDYDCDGKERRRMTTRAFCREREDGTGCVSASGWVERKIPRCGEAGRWKFYECVAQLVPEAAPGSRGEAGQDQDAEGTAPRPGASGPPEGAGGGLTLPPRTSYRTVYRCRGRQLPWKKRQLCR